EVLDQIRQDICDGLDDFGNIHAHEECAVDDPVQQVLNGPGGFTDTGGADQTAGTFQGMEGPTHFGQGFPIVLIGQALRQELLDGFQHFGRFFYEDFQNLVVNQVC